jgi:DNA-directed RNA polymerase specialized sigma24 family protein
MRKPLIKFDDVGEKEEEFNCNSVANFALEEVETEMFNEMLENSNKLTSKQLQVLFLRLVSGLCHRDIGHMMGKTQPCITYCIHRALEKLNVKSSHIYRVR